MVARGEASRRAQPGKVAGFAHLAARHGSRRAKATTPEAFLSEDWRPIPTRKQRRLRAHADRRWAGQPRGDAVRERMPFAPSSPSHPPDRVVVRNKCPARLIAPAPTVFACLPSRLPALTPPPASRIHEYRLRFTDGARGNSQSYVQNACRIYIYVAKRRGRDTLTIERPSATG